MTTDWPKLVRDLQIEHEASERQIAHQAKLPRSTLRLFFAGMAALDMEQMEAVLALFGYELDIFKVGEATYVPLPRPEPKAKPVAISTSQTPVRKKKLIIIRSMQRGAI